MASGKWIRTEEYKNSLLKGEKIQCPFCKIFTYKKPSEIKRGRKFCSQKCSSISRVGKKLPSLSEERKEILRKFNLGRKGEIASNWKGGFPKCSMCQKVLKSYNAKNCVSCRGILNRGENNYKWKKDRDKLKRYLGSEERRSPAYKFWRNEVYKRDNRKCRINNEDCCGRIEVHHILCFEEHPRLRYIINNGITLCHFHHPRKRVEEIKLSPYFQKLVAELE